MSVVSILFVCCKHTFSHHVDRVKHKHGLMVRAVKNRNNDIANTVDLPKGSNQWKVSLEGSG